MRYERKYLLSNTQSTMMPAWIKRSGVPLTEVYYPRHIHNIYFDSIDNQALWDVLAGIPNRWKLRYRWYQEAGQKKAGQLEVKTKQGLLGDKLSEKTKLIPSENQEMDAFQNKLVRSVKNKQLNRLLKQMKPTVSNFYQRSYYQTLDHSVRMTIDKDIQHQVIPPKWKLNQKVKRPCHYAIIELKYEPEAEEIASTLVSKLPLRLTKHSKYQMAYVQ